jgi:hypothetical protein
MNGVNLGDERIDFVKILMKIVMKGDKMKGDTWLCQVEYKCGTNCRGPKKDTFRYPTYAIVLLYIYVISLSFLFINQAAGRHQCSYLVNLHTQEFILAGGDLTWLDGVQFIPPKLRDLYDINKILAHRPWLITKDHISVSVRDL